MSDKKTPDIDYNKLIKLRRMTDADIRAAHTRVRIEYEDCPPILDDALTHGRWRHLITLQVIEALSAEDAATRHATVISITGKTKKPGHSEE